MTTKKKILTIVLSVAGVCAIGAGIVYGVKSSQKSEVLVIPVSDINNGGYWNGGSSMTGVVTSDVSQDVHLADTQTVEQVLVKEGDKVKEGDVLLTYDMTLTNLNLEMQKLSRDQADLRLQVAKNDLKKLKNTKPVEDPGTDDPGEGGFPDIPDEPDVPDDFDPEPTGEPIPEPTDTPVVTPTPTPVDAEVFNGTDHPLNYKAFTEAKHYMGDGTRKSPYRFLCENNTVIESSFMNAVMGYTYDEDGKMGERGNEGVYFRLEVRIGDKPEGALIKAWTQDASQITEPFPEDWKGIIDLAENEIVTPTPTAAPTPTEPGDKPSPSPIRGSRTVAGRDMRGGLTNLSMKGTVPHAGGMAQNMSALGGDGPDGGSSEMTYTKEELKKAIREKESEIKELELNLREQDLKLRVTQKAVDDGQVVAKINGVVKKVGDPKNPPKDGSAFLSVSSSEGLYVKGTVNELNLDTVKEGTVVTVTSWQSGVTCEATIKEVSPYPESNYNDYNSTNASGYPFTAYIASGGEQLQNYEYVEMTMSQQMSPEDMMGGDTISLSKAFIREEDGVKFVYIRGEDGRLKKQEVQVGRLFWGDTYEIKSGITVEDWIAFPYGKYVKEGARTKEGTMNQLYGY